MGRIRRTFYQQYRDLFVWWMENRLGLEDELMGELIFFLLLPERKRDILILRLLGLTVAEIAALLTLEEHTVKLHVNYIKKALRELGICTNLKQVFPNLANPCLGVHFLSRDVRYLPGFERYLTGEHGIFAVH